MSLPAEHMTPRLESLKGDLRARAEKIIKKKFGLDKTKSSSGLKLSSIQDQVAAQLYSFRNSGVSFSPELPDPPVLHIDRMVFDPRSETFTVEITCLKCIVRTVLRIDALHVRRGAGHTVLISCRCGGDKFYIDDNDFARAYERSRGLDIDFRF